MNKDIYNIYYYEKSSDNDWMLNDSFVVKAKSMNDDVMVFICKGVQFVIKKVYRK